MLLHRIYRREDDKEYLSSEQDILSEDLLKEFSEMKCNSTAKNNFEAMVLTDLVQNMCTYMRVYIGTAANCILFLFSSTYICKSSFSS